MNLSIKCLRVLFALLVVMFAFLSMSTLSPTQEHRERTIDEVKAEAIKRAENGMYPLIGLDPADGQPRSSSTNIYVADEGRLFSDARSDTTLPPACLCVCSVSVSVSSVVASSSEFSRKASVYGKIVVGWSFPSLALLFSTNGT